MTEATLTLEQAWGLSGLSIREQIMRVLLTRAQALVPTASRDPVRVPVEMLPRLVVQDQTETGREPVYRKHQMVLPVVCEYSDRIIIDDHSLSSAGNYLLANLLQAMLTPDITLGGLCSELRYETATIDYPEGGDSIIRVTVGLTVHYGFAFGNPFSIN